MTAYDRSRVLKEIREELRELEKDYPDGMNVPEDRRITIISTSLIEAGVDLDVYTVFRERTGLDSILQTGGRCNRESAKKAMSLSLIWKKKTDGRLLMNGRILQKGCWKNILIFLPRNVLRNITQDCFR